MNLNDVHLTAFALEDTLESDPEKALHVQEELKTRLAKDPEAAKNFESLRYLSQRLTEELSPCIPSEQCVLNPQQRSKILNFASLPSSVMLEPPATAHSFKKSPLFWGISSAAAALFFCVGFFAGQSSPELSTKSWSQKQEARVPSLEKNGKNQEFEMKIVVLEPEIGSTPFYAKLDRTSSAVILPKFASDYQKTLSSALDLPFLTQSHAPSTSLSSNTPSFNVIALDVKAVLHLPNDILWESLKKEVSEGPASNPQDSKAPVLANPQ